MAGILRRSSFDDRDYVSCPVGGSFYLCADVNYDTFLGCCDANPCSGRMCSEDDLSPMGFGEETSPAPDYPNHSCPYGGLWYTCADNDPPFQGCCDSDPCNGDGCPKSDLRAAGVHTVEVAGGSTFTVPMSSATWIIPSSDDMSLSYITIPTSTSSTQDLTTSSDYSYYTYTSPREYPLETGTSTASRTATIAGGTVAAVVVLAILLGLACLYYKRRSKKQKASSTIAPTPVAPEKDTKSVPECSAICAPKSARTASFVSANAPMPPGSPSSGRMPLPTYSIASSAFPSGIPSAATSSFMHVGPSKSDSMAPSEIMGTELSEQEYKQRTRSHMLGTGMDEPIELAAFPLSTGARDSDLRSMSFMSRPDSETGITGYSGQSLRESTATGGLPIPRPFSGYRNS